MRSKTDLVGLHWTDRLRQMACTYRPWLLTAGSTVTGFIMANSFVLGSFSPFGVALCAALPWKYVTAAALGSVLGHIFTFGNIENMKYIAAILLVVVFQWILSQQMLRIPRGGVRAVVGALFGMSFASALILLTMDSTVYDLLSNVAELLLCAAAAYFFCRTLHSLEVGFAGASRADLSCIAISFTIVITGFAPLTIAGVSLGRIIAVFIILMAARYGKEGGGAIAGITAGIAMGFSGGDFAYTIAAYAFGGLMAGIFGHVGRLACAAVFVLINALAAIFVGSTMDAYAAVVEIFVASVVFMALPNSAIKKLRLLPMGADGGDSDGVTHLALRQRLGDVSYTLREISSTTHEVSRRLGKMERQDFADLYSQVASKVCRHCGMRTHCWQQNYNTTMAVLADSVRVMRRSGTVNREDVPAHFSKICVKLDSLLSELNSQFRMQLSREGVARKVSQVRSVVTDQFDGMSMMLTELAEDLSTRRSLPREQQQRVQDYFEKRGITFTQLFCYRDSTGRISIEVRMPGYQLPRLEKIGAALDLSALLETEFDTPATETMEDDSMLVLFSEKASFTALVGAFQIASGRNRLCGDSYEVLRDRTGQQHLILSDGMGSGGNAAVDSTMASGLIARLLGVGVSHQAALKMVNSALLIKSGDESLATIDVCTIDLFSGEASFYKAGAAPTYILRAGKSGFVESTSLPAGILRGVAFEKSSLRLGADDVIIMVSDGVTATGTDWLLSEMKSIGSADVQHLCESIAATAAMRRTDKHADDITVMALKLQRGI